jgi:hypothetical protein
MQRKSSVAAADTPRRPAHRFRNRLQEHRSDSIVPKPTQVISAPPRR